MGKFPGGHKYNAKWEKEFPWLKPVTNISSRAFCLYCKTDMKAKLDIVRDHANGKRHKARSPYSNENAQLPFKPLTVVSQEVKKVELKLTAMAVCHTSFNALNHIGEIVEEEGKGSNLQKIKLHRTKESKNNK
jgi:hypothetical protein